MNWSLRRRMGADPGEPGVSSDRNQLQQDCFHGKLVKSFRHTSTAHASLAAISLPKQMGVGGTTTARFVTYAHLES